MLANQMEQEQEKKIISVRREIWKMLNEWYTSEQIEDRLTIGVEGWEIKMWQIISALVQSRVEELDYKNKIEWVLEMLS